MKPQHSPGATPCGLLLSLVSAPHFQVLHHHLHCSWSHWGAITHSAQGSCAPATPRSPTSYQRAQTHTPSSWGGDWHQTPASGSQRCHFLLVTSGRCGSTHQEVLGPQQEQRLRATVLLRPQGQNCPAPFLSAQSSLNHNLISVEEALVLKNIFNENQTLQTGEMPTHVVRGVM